MENIAHGLMGLRMGQLGAFRRVGPRAALIGVIAANIPDLDVLVYVFNRDLGNWEHRGFTHSLVGWPVLSLLGAAASSSSLRTGRFRDHLGLWAAAIASHLVLDVPTTWGTQLLWPDDRRFGLELIFIVDPVFWLLLGLLPWWLARRGRPAPWAGILALGGWFGVAFLLKSMALTRAPEPVQAVPGPLAPLFWTGFSRPGPGDLEIRRYWLTPWSCEPAGAFGTPRGAAWDSVLATHAGERDAWMSISPAVLRQDEQGGVVTLGIVDLGFTSWLDPDRFPFGHVYTVTAEGTVTRTTGSQRR